MSHVGSESLLQMRSHNVEVMEKARANQFSSTNIAKEVLNKPIQKKAYLAAAHSMRPYSNPNNLYFQHKAHTNLLRQFGNNKNHGEQM